MYNHFCVCFDQLCCSNWFDFPKRRMAPILTMAKVLRRLRKLRQWSLQHPHSVSRRLAYCRRLTSVTTSQNICTTAASLRCCRQHCGRGHIAYICQRYYEVITLASDCLSDSVQTYARRSQRNQSFASNGHNNTDLLIAMTSSASFSNDDWIRYPSHQDTIRRQRFHCCWTARVERSSRRCKERYRLVILQPSHQDILFICIGIFGWNSSTFPDCASFKKTCFN